VTVDCVCVCVFSVSVSVLLFTIAQPCSPGVCFWDVLPIFNLHPACISPYPWHPAVSLCISLAPAKGPRASLAPFDPPLDRGDKGTVCGPWPRHKYKCKWPPEFYNFTLSHVASRSAASQVDLLEEAALVDEATSTGGVWSERRRERRKWTGSSVVPFLAPLLKQENRSTTTGTPPAPRRARTRPAHPRLRPRAG